MNALKTILAAMLTAVSVFASAQSGYVKVANPESFKTQMLETAKNMNTLQSSFTQTQHISGMAADMVQTGQFYFKKSDKLLLDYITPMKSQIVVNGSKIKITSGGKSSVVDASVNPAVSNLKNMLASCLSGQLPANSADLQLTIYENSTTYMVNVLPKGGNLAKRTDHIEVVILKTDYSVVSVKIVEKPKNASTKAADYTEYKFSEMKKNAPIDDAKFKL